LATANNYSGATTLIGGVLSVSTSANLGDSSPTNFVLFTGGTLRATGTLASAARNVTVNPAGGTIDTNGNSVSFGNVSGAGSLTKTNSGNLTVNYARIANLSVTGGSMTIAANGGATGVSVVNPTTVTPPPPDNGDNHPT